MKSLYIYFFSVICIIDPVHANQLTTNYNVASSAGLLHDKTWCELSQISIPILVSITDIFLLKVVSSCKQDAAFSEWLVHASAASLLIHLLLMLLLLNLRGSTWWMRSHGNWHHCERPGWSSEFVFGPDLPGCYVESKAADERYLSTDLSSICHISLADSLCPTIALVF